MAAGRGVPSRSLSTWSWLSALPGLRADVRTMTLMGALMALAPTSRQPHNSLSTVEQGSSPRAFLPELYQSTCANTRLLS